MPGRLSRGMNSRMDNDRRQRVHLTANSKELDLRKLVQQVVGLPSVFLGHELRHAYLRDCPRQRTGDESRQGISAMDADTLVLLYRRQYYLAPSRHLACPDAQPLEDLQSDV
jgi:hypothetical protein